MSAADSNTSLPEKKSGYTFGHNETLLLISLYQKYEVFSVMFRTRKRQFGK